MSNQKTLKQIVYKPLNTETLKAFEILFGNNGACGGCWCMAWRLSRKAFVDGKGSTNKNRMRKLVRAGKEPGLLAFLGEEAIGWVAAAPREEYDFLNRSRVLRKIDDKPVWSVSCLFIRKDFRMMGLSSRLLKEVKKFVKARGGKIVEGYPYKPNQVLPGAFVWTGLTGSFVDAGYKEAARFSDSRPIFRAKIGR